LLSAPPVDEDAYVDVEKEEYDEDEEDVVEFAPFAAHTPSAPKMPPCNVLHTISFAAQSAPSVSIMSDVSCMPSDGMVSHHPATSIMASSLLSVAAHPTPSTKFPSVIESHLLVIESIAHPSPRNSMHPIPMEMSYECMQLPRSVSDLMIARLSFHPVDPEEEEAEHAPSGKKVPPTNVTHAISLPSQSDAGNSVIKVNLYASTSTLSTLTTHHPARSSRGHVPDAPSASAPPFSSHLDVMVNSVHDDVPP
jgi:hypothetical protein